MERKQNRYPACFTTPINFRFSVTGEGAFHRVEEFRRLESGVKFVWPDAVEFPLPKILSFTEEVRRCFGSNSGYAAVLRLLLKNTHAFGAAKCIRTVEFVLACIVVLASSKVALIAGRQCFAECHSRYGRRSRLGRNGLLRPPCVADTQPRDARGSTHGLRFDRFLRRRSRLLAHAC